MEIKYSKNIYRLPFDENLSIRAEAAPFHYESDRLRYAVDFPMEEGTPVMAALDGIVLKIIDEYGSGGPEISFLPKCNLIILQHINDEYSAYVHLKKGCLVEVGDDVKEGQIIAYSGISGFVSYPHLHFEVMIRVDDKRWLSIPARFRLGGGVKILSSPRG